MEPRRIAIIGAGPMGLEAALRAAHQGYEVTVYEKDRIGAHLLKWGHVRFFSAVQDSVSDLLWETLPHEPDPKAYLTGKEFVEQILRPLVESPSLQGKVREGCAVRSVARRRLIKTEIPGHPLRTERPFQLLIHSRSGGEDVVEADIVLDAGGVYGTPNWAGESGMPCPGEREASLHICRHLPDLLNKERSLWSGKDILLIGAGHSAATAVVWLHELMRQNSKTRVFWVIKGDRSRPCHEVANDPLPEREKTVRMANDVAERPPEGWRIFRKSALLKVGYQEAGRMDVLVGRGEKREMLKVHTILSLTGYRPDTSNSEELQVFLSPVTGGAGGLSKSLMSITDCLSPVRVAPESLESGEKNFFLIGHKSYGRFNTFLLKSGLEQLDLIFKRLEP